MQTTPRITINQKDESGEYKAGLPTPPPPPPAPAMSAILVHTTIAPTDLDGSGDLVYTKMLVNLMGEYYYVPKAMSAVAYTNPNGDAGFLYELLFEDEIGLVPENCVTSLYWGGGDDTLIWIGGAAPSITDIYIEKQSITIAAFDVEPNMGSFLSVGLESIQAVTFINSNPRADLVDNIIISVAANAVEFNNTTGELNLSGNENPRTAASDTAVDDLTNLGWTLVGV